MRGVRISINRRVQFKQIAVQKQFGVLTFVKLYGAEMWEILRSTAWKIDSERAALRLAPLPYCQLGTIASWSRMAQ